MKYSWLLAFVVLGCTEQGSDDLGPTGPADELVNFGGDAGFSQEGGLVLCTKSAGLWTCQVEYTAIPGLESVAVQIGPMGSSTERSLYDRGVPDAGSPAVMQLDSSARFQIKYLNGIVLDYTDVLPADGNTFRFGRILDRMGLTFVSERSTTTRIIAPSQGITDDVCFPLGTCTVNDQGDDVIDRVDLAVRLVPDGGTPGDAGIGTIADFYQFRAAPRVLEFRDGPMGYTLTTRTFSYNDPGRIFRILANGTIIVDDHHDSGVQDGGISDARRD